MVVLPTNDAHVVFSLSLFFYNSNSWSVCLCFLSLSQECRCRFVLLRCFRKASLTNGSASLAKAGEVSRRTRKPLPPFWRASTSWRCTARSTRTKCSVPAPCAIRRFPSTPWRARKRKRHGSHVHQRCLPRRRPSLQPVPSWPAPQQRRRSTAALADLVAGTRRTTRSTAPQRRPLTTSAASSRDSPRICNRVAWSAQHTARRREQRRWRSGWCKSSPRQPWWPPFAQVLGRRWKQRRQRLHIGDGSNAADYSYTCGTATVHAQRMRLQRAPPRCQPVELLVRRTEALSSRWTTWRRGPSLSTGGTARACCLWQGYSSSRRETSLSQ